MQLIQLRNCKNIKVFPIILFLLIAAGCLPPQYYQSTASGSTSNAQGSLEGCVIVAADGQMLGVITSNEYDTNSFLNQYGNYGNKYSATSIWNEYGAYGGQYAALSPFNAYANTPPQIIAVNGQAVGFLTVNSSKTPAVSPYALVSLMRK